MTVASLASWAAAVSVAVAAVFLIRWGRDWLDRKDDDARDDWTRGTGGSWRQHTDGFDDD